MDNTMTMIKERKNDWLEFNNINIDSRGHCSSIDAAAATTTAVQTLIFELHFLIHHWFWDIFLVQHTVKFLTDCLIDIKDLHR